jgi:hypothetical protein
MTHVHIHLLFRVTDTVTSQNIDFLFWDILYRTVMLQIAKKHSVCGCSDERWKYRNGGRVSKKRRAEARKE